MVFNKKPAKHRNFKGQNFMQNASDLVPDQSHLASKDPFLDHLKSLCSAQRLDDHSIESLVAATERAAFLETNHGTETSAGEPADAPEERCIATELKGIKQVGEYRLGKQIGKGGSSQVFEALKNDSDRLFAIKIYTLAGIDSFDRLGIERQILIRVRHPNIIELSDFGQTTEGIYYIVMPRIEGVRIDQYVRKNAVDVRGVAKLFADVATTLQHIHRCGVMHRDLKPSNILVTPKGTPIVMDFGLAKLTSRSEESSTLPSITATGTILGTLGYIAPEQIVCDDHNTDLTIDIYGLGATLYKVLTGETPQERRNLLKAIRESQNRHTLFPPEIKKQIPSDLRSICLKCLEISPGDRYQSMDSLKADLLAFSNGDSVRVSRPGFLTWCIRRSQKAPLTAGLASGLTLSLIALIALILLLLIP